MNTKKLVVLAVVGLGVVGALVLRELRAPAPLSEAAATHRPRLVELGSTSCQSCKAMHEELAQLRDECGTSIAVQEIDVLRDEAAAQRYGVTVIPTQVLLDANGQEIDRHTGFLARAEIRKRFSRRGVDCRR